MNILGPAVIRINCKYSTRSFLFTDIRPRAVFFEDPVDLFRESYTLIYRNFYTSSAIRTSLCFWSLTCSLLWSFWQTGCKCSCIRAKSVYCFACCICHCSANSKHLPYHDQTAQLYSEFNTP